MSRAAGARVRPPELPARFEPLDSSGSLLPREIFEHSIADAILTSAAGEPLSIASSRVRSSRLGGARIESLTDSVLEHCDCANAAWADLRMRRTVFRECGCTGLGLAGVALTDVVFSDCKLNLACLIGATLTRVRFERCDLREADFDGAELHDVVFRRCELGGARLVRTPLARVDLRGSRLGSIVLSPELITGCTIDEAQTETFAAAIGLRVLPLEESSDGL